MQRKHLLLLLAAVFLLHPLIGQAGVGTGALVKSNSNASIYYVGQDQKRYAFPTEAVFKSWFDDFSNVQTISDQTLASYPLIKNVTYRPGTRLVKITTDPKVYAVARGSILRWVQTEAVARALYGDMWATQVDDVADAFFANYQVGNPITIATEFNRLEERNNTISIDTNQTPVPTPTPLPPVAPPASTITTTPPSLPPPVSISIQTSTPTPRYGERFTLRTEASPATRILRTKLFLDNTELSTCEYYICATDILIPLNDVHPSHEIRVEAYSTDGRMSSSTLQVLATTGGSPYTNLILRRSDVEPNENREIIAQASSDFTAQYLNIYLDGNLIRSCINTQECRYIERETSPIGTIHTTFVVAINQNGSSARSETKTFQVVSNDSPAVEVTPDKNNPFTNEHVNITVNANDNDGIQRTSILLDGVVLKTCSLSTCSVSIGPWTEAKSLRITGQATDLLGATATATSSLITVRIP